MRREMGEAEKRLWTRLRRNQIGFHFRRQAPVGPYFLDVYCAKARLCIEVDGDLHAQRSAEDRQRDLYQSPSQSLLITRQTLQRLPYPIPTH